MLRRARAEPTRLHLGLDTDRRALARASTAAARRPERGGAPNACFVLADALDPPSELCGLVDAMTVLFPWGSLLRVVALPDIEVLARWRALLRPGARFGAVLSVDGDRDAREAARLGLDVSRDGAGRRLSEAYRAAGFGRVGVESLDREDLKALPSTWAKRHAFGRERPVWCVRATA
ncbi:MAG: hypothetical protein GEU80_15065 [Dehalococcoidia bacterium]|nr:hypothetical protein [Dehalococcoidia bacterium]